MGSRSGRGRWQRVLEARQQARAALGRDPNQSDLFEAPPKPTAPIRTPELVEAIPDPYARVERVLSLGEAAVRLGVSRGELERMIEAGKVEALPTGFTRMIPTREIERLTHQLRGPGGL
jgi:excisionase family DNA binding protein